LADSVLLQIFESHIKILNLDKFKPKRNSWLQTDAEYIVIMCNI
jgi:hypothetical protein